MNHLFYVYPVINEVLVLIKLVEKNEMLYSTKMLKRINMLSEYLHRKESENQHAVKVLTQKGICGTVLTVQYLSSGEHKNYDNFKTSNPTDAQHISG